MSGSLSDLAFEFKEIQGRPLLRIQYPSTMPAQYAIGIDLGTTNSALAYAPLNVDAARVELLPIPQLIAPSTVEPRKFRLNLVSRF